MKTIFITSYHSFISRNILRTEVLAILKNSGVRIVILVPPGKADYFIKNFSGKNVEIAGIEPRNNFLHNLLYFLSVCLVSVENLFIQGLLSEKRFIRFYLALLIYKVFGRIFAAKRGLRFFYNNFIAGYDFTELFDRYEPALVFSTDICLPR